MDLTLSRVTVRLGRARVLEEVSAVLRPGRVTAILGPNGAGKSSLLRSIAALVPLAGGEIALGGRSIAGMDPRERARRIGYLPQQGVVHWNLAAGDLVALGRLPHGTGAAENAAAIAAAMEATDTAQFANRPVDQLSGGELARVLLARVLAGAPQWILADEPLASLDPAHQIDVLDRLRAVAGCGTGVAIVLHDLAHAARIADDVLLLANGRPVAAGPAAEVLTADRLGALFGIELAFAETSRGRVPVVTGRTPG